MRRPMRALLAVVAGSMVLTGCDFDVYKLPLPGGADVGSDPMTIKVQFADVLDLVPQSSVKVDDVTVGKVTDIDLDGQIAVVTVSVNNDVDLPANAAAQIRQTSLLGEKFVSLSDPTTEPASGQLASGDEIPLDRTGRNPEVEEVFAALSALLTGGGVAQLKTITVELNKALEGREDAAKSVLRQIDVFMTQLDENKTDIVDAIESLNRLAVTVRGQQDSIDAALDDLPSALASLDRQRDDLVRMLQSLDRLGQVGVRVIRRSKASTIEALTQLQPVLTELSNSGDNFVKAFNVFYAYPFVDEVVGRDPQVARNLHMGDYTNLSIQLDLDLTNPGSPPGVPCYDLSEIPDDGPLPALEELCDGAQDAVGACLSEQTPQACEGLPQVVCADLPIPGLCAARRTGLGASRDPDALAGLGGLGGRGLGGLGGLGGGSGPGVRLPDVTGLAASTTGIGPARGLLSRPAVGGTAARRDPALSGYDAALVDLLLAGRGAR